MIKYGTEKTITPIDTDSSITTIKKIDKGEPYKVMRQYRIRVSVRNAQEELTEFVRFTTELTKLRKEKKLAIDANDPLTTPHFMVDYPKQDLGNWFIIKCYTVVI